MESADNTGHFDWDNFLSQHPHSLVTPSATYEELARTVAGLSPTKLTQIGYGFLAEIEPMRIMPAVKSILLEEYQAERGGLMTWLDIEIKKSREANKKNQPRLYTSNPDYSREGITSPPLPGGSGMYKGHGKGHDGQWDKPKSAPEDPVENPALKPEFDRKNPPEDIKKALQRIESKLNRARRQRYLK